MNAPWWGSVLVGVVLLGMLAAAVGLAALILWLRDRGGLIGTVMHRLLGLVTLLLGLASLVGVIVGLFHGVYFGILGILPAQYILGGGWEWLTGPAIEDARIELSSKEAEASITKARATLPWFLDQVERNADEAWVKSALEISSGEVEREWAYVESCGDGCLHVSPSDDPIHTGEEYYAVPVEQVEDWQIVRPDGRIKGAYSLIALFEHFESQGKRLSPKMRKQKAMLIDAGQGEEA